LLHIVYRIVHYYVYDYFYSLKLKQRIYVKGINKMFTRKDLIKVKALCLFENDGYIFVFEAYDSVKQDNFYRPIGGTTELREYTIDTLKREIKEELNTEVKNVKLKKVVENIFICDGLPGHEIDFIYQADFCDPSFYEHKEYELVESNDERLKAFWISIKDCIEGRYRLVPEVLIEYYKDNMV